MGRLHRRDHAEFLESRNVGGIDNLRMLHSPPRLFDWSLIRRDCFEGRFVRIENRPVRSIADRVCLNLKTAPQRLLEHWLQLFRLFGEVAGSLRGVAVRFEQCGPARTKRTVEHNFNRALSEMVIERINGRAFFQKILRVFTWTVNAIHETDFGGTISVSFLDEIDISLRICGHSVSEVAAGVLNFAPAESDLAIDSSDQRLLALARRWCWNIFAHEFLRAVG